MIHLIELENTPIFDQLQLEEALLRAHSGNFCIMNTGAPRAIVMGISGKEEELIHPSAREAKIPIIRRFSGGGTVLVDENTVFVTFIFDASYHGFKPYPEPIYRWSEELYKDVFPKGFSLKENDYALDDLKFGGNAQYIRKDRWLHHSTLLWDFSDEHMAFLKHPKKTPSYRDGRDHSAFLTSLRSYYESVDELKEQMKTALEKRFRVVSKSVGADELTLPHRKTTSILE